MKITAKDIEKAIVNTYGFFANYRNNTVVPNVSYGLCFNHELDLCVLTKSGYIHEIEIKISKSDLIRDAEKWHQHKDPRIRCLWFAGPYDMKEDFENYVPDGAGIILISDNPKKKTQTAKIHRKAKPKKAKKITEAENLKLLQLMILRYWTIRIKEKL